MRRKRTPRLRAATRWKGALPWLALAAVYGSTAGTLHQLWVSHPYGGHGPLVPGCVALVLWRDRATLRTAMREGSSWGLVLTGLGLLALAIGVTSGNVFLQVLSAVPAIAGIVWWRYGPVCLRQSGFAIALLLFVLPLPRRMAAVVTTELQTQVAAVASRVLAAAGVPFYHDGVRIELAAATLEVAEICNGLRFFMALLTLALVLAKVVPQPWVHGVLVVGSALPFAFGANVFRVVTIAVAVHFGGVEWAGGPRHHLIGKVVWLLAVLALLAWSSVVGRVGVRAQARLGRRGRRAPAERDPEMPARAGAA